MAKTRTLTVRNVPDEVVRTLRRRARTNGRSMQQEVLALLRRDTIDRESAVAQLLEQRKHLRKSMTIEAIEASVNEGRP